jgi:hypothetical protein
VVVWTNEPVGVHPEFLALIGRSREGLGRPITMDEMKRRVLSKRSPNKRMQPTARRARRG